AAEIVSRQVARRPRDEPTVGRGHEEEASFHSGPQDERIEHLIEQGPEPLARRERAYEGQSFSDLRRRYGSLDLGLCALGDPRDREKRSPEIDRTACRDRQGERAPRGPKPARRGPVPESDGEAFPRVGGPSARVARTDSRGENDERGEDVLGPSV